MKTVIEMAHEAGFSLYRDISAVDGSIANLKRFAELVAAAENEACEKVCDGWEFVPGSHEFTPQQLTKNLTDTIATQIRARRKT